MNGGGRVAKLLVALTGVALAVSACLPFPPVVRGPQATRSVFMPGVAESGAAVSPLQPTLAPSAPTVIERGSETTPSAKSGVTGLQGPVWQWRASKFVDGAALAPEDPSRYTVEFLPDGNALVQADCNFGTGSYQEDGERLTIGAIGATKTACPADSLDSAFLAQLTKVERFAVAGEGLTLWLQNKAGEMRLGAQPGTVPPTLTPLPATAAPTHTVTPPPTLIPTAMPTEPPATPTAAPTPAFTATSAAPATPAEVEIRAREWVLRTLTVGGQKKPAMGETPATLEISPDGLRVSGSTGCNEYRAGVTLDGRRFAFSGPALLTRTACDWPVMLQEVELIDALLRATGYRFADGLLVLTGVDGENLAEFAGK